MFIRYYDDLDNYIKPNKVLIIYGARRVGKTTLIKNFLATSSYKYKLVSGDNISVKNILQSGAFEQITEFCKGYELIVIDEAQEIENIGLALKIIVDNVENIKVIATGSSSFDLANKIGEPLVGRKKTLTMFTLSQLELKNSFNNIELKENLENYLRFGSYPEVLTSASEKEKIEYLEELIGSYLYKDILSFYAIRSSDTIQKLLRMLAFQIGNEVSIDELAKALAIDNKTVLKYLDLLEKYFIIIKLGAYSSNLRKELNKKNKYYFIDLGIRNALISNFNRLELRDDKGGLWENFVFLERLKRNKYKGKLINIFFWRNYQKKEIDLIEEQNGKIMAYELKWKEKESKNTKSFLNQYPEAKVEIINSTNYLDFVAS